MKIVLRFALFVCAATIFSGCAGYEKNAENLRAQWRAGNFSASAQIAATAEKDASDTDALVWQLECGTTRRALGDLTGSQQFFEKAAQTVAFWDEKADVLISREVAAGLTNLSALPYRGRGSDIIMLHTYRALNFLEKDDSASARVALNAAYKEQSEAVFANEKNIAQAQSEARKSSVNVSKLCEGKIDKEREKQNAELADVRVLADYVNAFTTWLHGIYFLHAGTDAADFERARVSLSRVGKMYPQNPYIAEDLSLAERASFAGEDLTYVIFESGLAPKIAESRVDTMIPVPIGGGKMTLAPISIALPKLVLSDGRKYWWAFVASGSYPTGNAAPQRVPALSANGVPASEICDMNSVVRTDFDNAYPAVLARTLIPAFVKAAASAAANAVALEYARRDASAASGLVALATIIGTSVYTYGSSGADVRCWQTLPQNFSIVRLKTPASRKLTLSVDGRTHEIELLPGRVNLVSVKTANPQHGTRISQAVLSK